MFRVKRKKPVGCKISKIAERDMASFIRDTIILFTFRLTKGQRTMSQNMGSMLASAPLETSYKPTT